MCSREIQTATVALAFLGAVACGGGEPTPPTPPTPPTTLAPPTPPTSPTPSGHAHEAPHGGTLVELGDHFGFLELVLDQAAGLLTVYVLDAEAEQAVRIAQPTISITFDAPERLTGDTLVLTAQANVLTGETVGDTSQFGGTHEALKGQSSLHARIGEVTVKGQTFRDVTVTPSK